MPKDIKADYPPDVAFSRFQDALRGVMKVSKSDLTRLLAKDEAKKSGKLRPGPKPRTSDHASRDKG